MYRYPTLQLSIGQWILSFLLVLNLSFIQLAVSNNLFTVDFFSDDDNGRLNDFSTNLDWSVPLDDDQFTDGGGVMVTEEDQFFDNDLGLADNLFADVDNGESCRRPPPIQSKKLKARESDVGSCSGSDAPIPPIPPIGSSIPPLGSLRTFSAARVTTVELQEYWCFDSPMAYGEVPVCSDELNPAFDSYVSLPATLSQF